MQAISATDTPLNLTALLNRAQQEPLMIRRNQRDVAVMLSAAEYMRLSKRPSASVRLAPIDPRLAATLDGCD
jgi:PHD/YefM family antitoxin component YafN of YafNO toxin-antitoxin module